MATMSLATAGGQLGLSKTKTAALALAALMRKLMHKCAVVFDNPLNAVFMKLAAVVQHTIHVDRQKFARLVTIVFIFNDCFYVFHNNTILAYSTLFVNGARLDML